MDKELEATFIDFDKDHLRQKLKQVGAEMVHPERLMRRATFSLPNKKDIKDTWLRVRDEGDKITMSIKKVIGSKIEDQEEICLEINDFEEGIKYLKAVGCQQKAYQETKREEWSLDEAEVCIDTWPGLEPIVEIEAKTKEKVKTVSEKLDFDYEQAIFGAINVVYELKLGIDSDDLSNRTPVITFENPPKNKKQN